MARSEIRPRHVEDFLDTSVEWLSANPEKGILIDFSGVTEVCDDFVIQLLNYYEEIKQKGLYVRFVNVSPHLKGILSPSNITVVITRETLEEQRKPKVNVKELLADLAGPASDGEIIEKHGLNEHSFHKMLEKLLMRGLITRRALALRWGVDTSVITLMPETAGAKKRKVDAREVLADLSRDLTAEELMGKYRLSRKGFKSMLTKLCKMGLISPEVRDEKLGSDRG
jgi:anti-anti-sigma regulatory factor/predicted transcriptional regulator